MEGVYVRQYDAPPVNPDAVARYACIPALTPQLHALLTEIRQELEGRLSCAVCWTRLPISPSGSIPGFSGESSASLRQVLPGCHEAILFGATLGLAPDRLLVRYGSLSPTRALLVQALGTAMIEALCDRFCKEIREEQEAVGFFTRPRFSPGYGNLPLTLQKDIFRILNCSGKIGLTLNDSLLMTPTKSVTAFVGISTCAPAHCREGCESCEKTDCPYRRNV